MLVSAFVRAAVDDSRSLVAEAVWALEDVRSDTEDVVAAVEGDDDSDEVDDEKCELVVAEWVAAAEIDEAELEVKIEPFDVSE